MSDKIKILYEIVSETVAGRMQFSVYRVNGARRAFLGSFRSYKDAEDAIALLKEGK